MRRYIKRAMTGPVIMPRMQTIGAFFGSMTNLVEASSLEQLFTLYDAYCEIYKNHSSFDKFRFWGEIIIEDFDDIDRQLADARDVFTNVKRLEEIQVDFLDENQREVARELWGYEPESFEGFRMNNRRKDGGEDKVFDGFERLTTMLWPLYVKYNELLEKQGLTTRGKIARMAAEKVGDWANDLGVKSENIAFIGFGVLSGAERRVFRTLMNMGRAEFFWDVPEMLTRDLPAGMTGYKSPLLKYINRLVKYFPMPAGYEPCPPTPAPQVRIVSVPSRSMQAKVAGNIINLLGSDVKTDRADNTVIVLPDSSILIPLLHSLQVPKVNVTMGIPVRNTPFATLLGLIIKLNLTSRVDRDGNIIYLTQNVLQIVSHPTLSVLLPESVKVLKRSLEKENRFVTTYSHIKEICPELAFIFSPIGNENNAEEARSYLTSLIDKMLELIAEVNGSVSDATLEQSRLHEHRVLSALKNAVETLLDLLEKHKRYLDLHDMSRLSFFRLIERQLGNEQLNFSGSPLVGIQIMGALETRSIDFDNVIMLSMNEKTFPPKNFVRSMLPSAIRAGYGLSTPEERELEYAWIYANLMSRCRKAYLLYNAASETKGRGGMSRYLYQTLFIYNGASPRKIDIAPNGPTEKPQSIVIPKSDAVMTELNRFRVGGDRNLSISALEKFAECPLKFYLSKVCRIQEAPNTEDAIDDATQGTVVHEVMQRVFEEVIRTNGGVMDSNFEIGEETVRGWLSESFGREWYGMKSMSYNELPVQGQLQVDVWLPKIMQIIECERMRPESYRPEYCELSPQDIIGHNYFEWKLDKDLNIRFIFYIDRVDRLNDGTLRFVDYKTGKDRLNVEDIDNLFWKNSSEPEKPATPNKAIFQLLAYAHAYSDLMRETGKPIEGNISLEIIKVTDPQKSVGRPLKIGETILKGYKDASVEEFKPRFIGLVKRIFDPTEDFIQTDNENNCQYCQFRNICGRTNNNS